MDRSRVLILGHGEMGHAMETLLGPHHSLAVWQRRGSQPLEELARDKDFIIFCLPASAHQDVATQLSPHRPPDALCLTIAKGLNDSGQLPVEVLSTALGGAPVAGLFGPMISEELRAGRPGFAECATTSVSQSARVKALFHLSALRVETSADIHGLSWSAILKNVYAMAFGMADELELGDNVRGFLAVLSLKEMSRIVHLLGGEAQTPYQVAGLGDLITTATSAGSHHHDLGRRLARGERHLQGEGTHTLDVLGKHPRFSTHDLPLYQFIDECVREPRDTRQKLGTLLHTAI